MGTFDSNPGRDPGSRNSSNPQESYGGPSAILLAPWRDRVPGRGLAWLVRLYGLDVYGAIQLSQRALFEMYGVACMLTVIFLFDAGTWSLLFNMITHAGVMEITFFKTLLSIMAGLVFATATLVYERQFMTSDWSWSVGKLRLFWNSVAVGLRVLVLVGAALVTSQSFELLVFDGAISDRVHEEAVWVEAIRQANEWHDEDPKTKPANTEAIKAGIEAKHPGITDNQKEAQSAAVQAMTDESSLKQQLDRARDSKSASHQRKIRTEGRIRKLNMEIEKAEQEGNSQALAVAQSELENQMKVAANNDVNFAVASDIVSTLEAKHSLALTKVKIANEHKAEITQVIDQTATENDQAREKIRMQAEGKQKLIRDWIYKIRQAPPKEVVYQFGGSEAENNKANGAMFVDPKRHIFEKLRIIEDLRYGRPPFYADATPEIRTIIIEKFELGELAKAAANSSAARSVSTSGAVTPNSAGAAEPGRTAPADAGRSTEATAENHETLSGSNHTTPSGIQVSIGPGKGTGVPGTGKSEKDLNSVGYRRELSGEQFNFTYKCVFVIAMVIPLLILAMKALIAQELKSYYSSTYQRARGNPDAAAHVEAMNEAPRYATEFGAETSM